MTPIIIKSFEHLHIGLNLFINTAVASTKIVVTELLGNFTFKNLCSTVVARLSTLNLKNIFITSSKIRQNVEFSCEILRNLEKNYLLFEHK